MNAREVEALEADNLHELFKRADILAIYGGGRLSKGHGFWLLATTSDEIRNWDRERGWYGPKGAPILNDGKRTGNEHFWAYDDARRLFELISNHVAAY